MTTKLLKRFLTMFGCLVMLATPSPWALAQQPIVNVLLIHGRTKSSTERYGVFNYDQMSAWGGKRPVTGGNVYYVQWDAWNRHFDDTTCPGGECIIKNAVNKYCNFNGSTYGQVCQIICHSAGCAAFENYLAKSNYWNNPIVINSVLAAESAAGGSELANNGLLRWIGGLNGSAGAIDNSLKTSYARSAYNHNYMQGVAVRSVGGTSYSGATALLIQCSFFPREYVGFGGNKDCKPCYGLWSECADGAVALHSSCAHNRAASYQDCNSTIPPANNLSGTFLYHGYWIKDGECLGGAMYTPFSGYCGPWKGPYSPTGKSDWNSKYHTFRINHSGGKYIALDEYSWAPGGLAP